MSANAVSDVKPGKVVLVVEDDPDLREFEVIVLRDGGYEVEECGSLAEAEAKLAERRFGLVLMDLNLPDGNGFSMLQRAMPSYPDTRFVVVTGDDAEESVLRALRHAVYDYVLKPVSPHVLLDVANRGFLPDEAANIEIISASPNWIELSLPCTRLAATRVENFMRHLKSDLTPDLRDDIGDAFRELLMNAVEWGGGLDPERRVRVSCLRTARMVLYRIADPGHGFRFEDLPHAAISNPAGPLEVGEVREKLGLRPGGLGLLLVEARADELLYNDAHNEVVFVRYLS
jgi:CheY-like chemotaxis protein